MTDDLFHRTHPPKHEALWPEDLFSQGTGWVIVEHLHLRCGPGNYDYLIRLGDAEDK